MMIFHWKSRFYAEKKYFYTMRKSTFVVKQVQIVPSHKASRMVKRHLSEGERGFALGLRRAGWKISDIAAEVNVTRCTISRMISKQQKDPRKKVPKRRYGSGTVKLYGRKQVDVIYKAVDRNPSLTSFDLKRMYPKTLERLSARTVRRILLEELDLPACVPPKKPYLTEAMKLDRIAWSKRGLRKPNKFWKRIAYFDEVLFECKGRAGGWRLVRRPKGRERFNPKYCKNEYPKTRKLMAVCGISATGYKFIKFLKPNQMMNSDLYCKILSKNVLGDLKRRRMKLLHDRSKVHTAKKTAAFLAANRVEPVLLSARSADLNPIENCFGLLKRRLQGKKLFVYNCITFDVFLQGRNTRNLKELKGNVRLLWNQLDKSYIQHLCSGMKKRMRIVINSNGEFTKY